MDHGALSVDLYLLRGSFCGVEPAEDSKMDARVWSMLPLELLGRVLLLLPPQIQFRFRVVCKHWLSILTSAHFQQQMASSTPPAPPVICGFCFSPSQEEAAASAAGSAMSRYRKYKLDLSFIPSRFHGVFSSNSVGLWSLYDTHCLKKVGYERKVVSQDGLILIRVCELVLSSNRQPDSSCELYVVNPFTRTCVRLPEIGLRPDPLGIMKVEVDKASNASFKVFVIYDTVNGCPVYNPWMVCVFSSTSNAWKVVQGEGPPSGMRSRFELFAEKFADVISNGVLYRYEGWNEGVLLVQNIEEGTSSWHKAMVPGNDHARQRTLGMFTLHNFFLVECCRSVYLVSQFRCGQHALSCGIWKLDLENMQWLRVSDPPTTALDGGWLVNPSAGGDTIFLTVRSSYPLSRTVLLGYNVVQDSWELLLEGEAPYMLTTDFYGFLEPRWNL